MLSRLGPIERYFDGHRELKLTLTDLLQSLLALAQTLQLIATKRRASLFRTT